MKMSGGEIYTIRSRGRIQTFLNLDDRKYDLLTLILTNFFSEVFGTGVLVFLGCLGVVRGLGQEGDHTGVVLSFALAVYTAVQITCHNSGGHVNPAVTIVSLFFKRLSYSMALLYIVAQLIGGILGFGLIKLMTPASLIDHKFEEHGLCTTVPNSELTLFQAFLSEFVLSTLLMLIVCSAWDPRNSHHDSLTLKFGFTIFSLAYAGVSYSGCSMNPARSLGPAVWNNAWKHHWIYWVGPFSAALFSGFVYTTFFCPPIPPLINIQTKDSKNIELEAVNS